MILIDNTVLSNFVLVDELLLLQEYCGGQGAMTDQIAAEYQEGIDNGIFPESSLDWLQRLHLETPQEHALFRNLGQRLGDGEASCLAIAMRRKYDILSDDMDARKIALREGIRLSGSIGVLLELIRIQRISLDTGNRILTGFIQHGYFSPVNKLDELCEC